MANSDMSSVGRRRSKETAEAEEVPDVETPLDRE
jgi:hypothetical protein